MFGKSFQERGKILENYLYYSDPFFAYNNALYIEKTINGKPVNIKLSNFLARITEDITCTNGAENERFLSIVGTDEKGNDLRKITVPLKNFSQLDWAQEYWGINCVIESGYVNRDNLRQAIQSTAKYADGALRDAQFDQPNGIVYDKETGSFYIADRWNHRIRTIIIE